MTSKPTTLAGYGIGDAYTRTQVDGKIASLVDSAPGTLDTLNELAAALGNDPNFATTIASQIGNKADTSVLTGHTNNSSIHVTASERTNWNNKLNSSGGTVAGALGVTGILTLGSGTTSRLVNQSDGSLHHQNNHGYIEIGPKNTSFAHIYTDRASFYFNKEIRVNGDIVYHPGNLSPARVVTSTTQPTSGLTDGLFWFNPSNQETQVYFGGEFQPIGGTVSMQDYRNSALVNTSGNQVQIGIPEYDVTRDILLVYQNSTMLEQGADYIITNSGTAIQKTSGMWAPGTTIHFVAMTYRSTNYVETPAAARERHVKSVIVPSATGSIVFNIAGYTKETDSLEVYHNGLKLCEGTHYSISGDAKSISLIGYMADPDDEFEFNVLKGIKTILV